MDFNGISLGTDVSNQSSDLGTVTSSVVSTAKIKTLTYLDWLNSVDSFLSLDISVRGTGWVMWKDKHLSWGRLKLNATDEIERAHEFHDWLLNLINDYHFDYYFVEDVIASVNFKTVRSLISLNNLLGDMIYRGEVFTPIALYKESNTTWKKNLRGTAGGDFVLKGVNYINGNDKACTKACLESLGVDINSLKANTYTDKQVEDVCDALGMALGTIAIKIKGAPLTKSKVITTDIRKGYVIKQFSDYDTARKSAERCAKTKSKVILEYDLVTSTANNLIKFLAPIIPDNNNTIFLVRVPVSKCCNLLLLKRLETTEPIYYLTITK